MKLKKNAFGLAMGVVMGVGVFLATIIVIIKEGGEHLIILRQFFPGYSISFIGSIFGLIEGFISGYIIGWILIALYNIFQRGK